MRSLRLVLPFVLCLSIGSTALPQGKGKGGGGSTPPPDPAIAFVGQAGNRYYLQVMNSDGTNVRTVLQLASYSGGNTKPALSPDGSQIAFGATFNSLTGIFVVNLDGTGLHCVTLTQENPLPFRPGWSPAPAPDGQNKIAFVDSTGAGGMEVFVVNVDGSDLQQLTSTTVGESSPAWSRDGSALAFLRSKALIVATLGVVDGDLAILQESDLTAAPGSPLQANHWLYLPAWANLSDVVVVSALTADSGGNCDLWLVDPASPHQPLRITFTPNSNEVFGTFGLDDARVWFGNGLVESCLLDGSGRATVRSGARAPNHRRY